MCMTKTLNLIFFLSLYASQKQKDTKIELIIIKE